MPKTISVEIIESPLILPNSILHYKPDGTKTYKTVKLIEKEISKVVPEYKDVHDKLTQHNIQPIYCRFRHRHFWDGGLHCLTVDTNREGKSETYL